MKKTTAIIALAIVAMLLSIGPNARADYVHYPGLPGDGPWAPTCVCIAWPNYSCGCAIQTQSP
jgi:hypothetical protein